MRYILIDRITEPTIFSEKDEWGVVRRAFHLVSVWFKNDPIVRSASAIAEQVTAHIEVSDASGRLVQSVLGQWVDEAKTKAAGDQGPLQDTLKRLDIRPGPIPAKLPVILDLRIPESAKGWYLYEAVDYVGQHRLWLQRAESYGVRIRLSGTNLPETEFAFALTEGDGRLPRLTVAPPAARFRAPRN